MFKLDKSRMIKTVKDTLAKNVIGSKHKVLWDDSSGTKVDAQVNECNHASFRWPD